MSEWRSSSETWPKVNSQVTARWGDHTRDDVIAHMEDGWVSTSGEPLTVPDAWKYPD